MKTHLNLNTALIRLESDSLEEQAQALNEAMAIFKEFGRRVVHRFVECEDRFIIWERLPFFGPCIIEPLKETLSQEKDPELRGLSALVLLKLNDKSGVPILLEVIASDEALLCQAALRLAEAQIVEAGDLMIERLRSLDSTNKLHIPKIQCLLEALKRLRKALPSDLIERFQNADAPWEVQAYL